MTFKPYRAQSRIDWGTESSGLTLEQINCGAMLRIADATEKMAQRHTELIQDRDYYEKQYNDWRREYEAMERRCRSLKGQITKMKKKGGAA